MKLEPEFSHDCDQCVFLGIVKRSEMILVTDEVASALTAHVEGEASLADLNKSLGVKSTETWDLYVCDKAHSMLGPSIIARSGHDGPDYKSAPHGYVTMDPELTLGLKLAREAGHIPMCGVTEDDGDDE